MILFSGFWIPRAGNLPLPIVALLYWSARTYASNTLLPRLLIQPLACLACALTVFFVHFDNPEVDQLLSFSRIVLPHCVALLSIACLSRFGHARHLRVVSGFMVMIILFTILDFSPYVLSPRAALLAQINPYDIKIKTLLFLDSNWSGYFLCASDTVARASIQKQPLWWRIAAPLLAFFSGSRSSLIYFIITISADLFELLTGFIGRYLSDWANLPLRRRRFSSVFLSALLALPLLFPLFTYFVLQEGEIVAASGDDSVSLSAQDGSFQTKIQITRYAIEALDAPLSLLVGNGPKIVKVNTNYSGHSIMGLLPEIGILGIFSYMLPIFLCVFRKPSSFVPMASLCLLSSTSFFPIAYMAPYLILWAIKSKPQSIA